MKDLRPAVFTWTGEAMVPTPESLPLCMRQFDKGALYQMRAMRERSVKSHNEFMALVKEAFDNLPEHLASRFPTVSRLRYWCLAKCGYCAEKTRIFQTRHDAKVFEDYVIESSTTSYCQVEGNVAMIWTPTSQRYKYDPEMDYEEFEKSKEAVLELLADMIGVHPRELKRNAGKAA